MYRFAYLTRELRRPDFRPLPGLTAAAKTAMSSPTLFPLFAERVISSRRPDRPASMAALGLPTDAAPFEVLARSQGHRVGDTIELLPAPSVEPGAPVSFVFPTHGVRHLEPREQDRITSLARGEELRLLQDRANKVNSRALLVCCVGDVRLGWVPDPLIEMVETIENVHLTVENANGPQVGFHFRLLVRFEGLASSAGGIFTGPEWTTSGP